MKNINYFSIDTSKLKSLNVESRSNIYLDDNNTVYKIFKSNDNQLLNNKNKKIDLFSKIDNDFICSPKDKIMEGNLLRGYTYDFIDGCCLYDLINKKNELIFVKSLIETSKKLKEFHNLEGKPVFGDMHFYNVIIDKDLNPHFIDVDSFGIDKYESDDIPVELYTYCTMQNYKIEKNQDYDRLSFMLSLFKVIFKDNILRVSPMDYKFTSRKYEFLDNKKLEDLYFNLRLSHSKIPEVPYIYELIRE